MPFIKQALKEEHLLAGLVAHTGSQPCFYGELNARNLFPRSQSSAFMTCINTSEEQELQRLCSASETLKSGGAQESSYSGTGHGRTSMIQCISKSDLSP